MLSRPSNNHKGNAAPGGAPGRGRRWHVIDKPAIERFLAGVRGQAMRQGTRYAREARVGAFIGSPGGVSSVVASAGATRARSTSLQRREPANPSGDGGWQRSQARGLRQQTRAQFGLTPTYEPAMVMLFQTSPGSFAI